MTDLRGRHIHFDCATGAAGDMALGALLDAGVPRTVIDEAIERLGVDRSVLRVEVVSKRGIRATDVKVKIEHEHGDHHHMPVEAIVQKIRAAGLDPACEALALQMFDRVARAEGKIHGKDPHDVELHEIGAIDSIVDIVGTAAAVAWLSPSSVSSSPVAMGHGTLQSAHGMLPVPSPAAIAILSEVGALVEGGGVARELCTPTGATILASIVTSWGEMPSMTALAIGYGAGDAELADRANVLRAIIGAAATAVSDEVFQVEANIDDMTPELSAHAAEMMFRAGALDVWWTPATMKKSRPGVVLSALVGADRLDDVALAVLRETTSIGVRFSRTARRVLDREHRDVDTPYGPIAIKVALLGNEIVNAAPEYEACRVAAERAGVPLKQVVSAAIAAWETARSAR